jgi:hypothetical protein
MDNAQEKERLCRAINWIQKSTENTNWCLKQKIYSAVCLFWFRLPVWEIEEIIQSFVERVYFFKYLFIYTTFWSPEKLQRVFAISPIISILHLYGSSVMITEIISIHSSYY